MKYGNLPVYLGQFDQVDLNEVMYYLYLPVVMRDPRMVSGDIRLPRNVEVCRPLITEALGYAYNIRNSRDGRWPYTYVYLSARKGWATADNPLNRPGWHADGFGTEDLNFVWWRGAGTRFAAQAFTEISDDHVLSQKQFQEQVDETKAISYPEAGLYVIDPSVVHATPIITTPGMRQYIKISLSNERYNLENNSHNYLFDYDWPLHTRSAIRNDPHKAQLDYVA